MELTLTEERNLLTKNIDTLPTLDMLTLINAEDQKVALAVHDELPKIAAAVDAIAKASKVPPDTLDVPATDTAVANLAATGDSLKTIGDDLMRTSVLALAASDKDISQATNVGNALQANASVLFTPIRKEFEP